MSFHDRIEDRADLGRRAEEECPGDAVDDDVRIGHQRGIVGLAIAIGIVGLVLGHQRHIGLDAGGLRHAVDEQHRAEREPDQNALGKIAEDGQQEGGEQHDGVPPRCADQGRKFVLLDHVPGDNRQHRGQRRERNVARQRRCDQHEQQQERRMQHPRHRAASAGADVGRGPRNQSGDADAAEQRGSDVGDALGHQFAIRAMPPSGHAVGHHRRQQRLDRSQQRERHGVGKHRLHFVERECRPDRPRQFTRNPTEARADGLHRQRQRPCGPGGDHNRDQHAGPRRPQLLQADDDNDCDDADRDRGHADGVAGPRQRRELRNKPTRLLRQRDSKNILDLAGKDDDADTGGEPHRNRIGNELDVGAEPHQAGGDQQHARHQSREDDAVNPVTLDRQRNQHDERAGGTADLKPAATEQRDKESAYDGGGQAAIRRDAGGDGDGHRQRQRHDRHRESSDDVGAEIGAAITLTQHGEEFRREQFCETRLADKVGSSLSNVHPALSPRISRRSPISAVR